MTTDVDVQYFSHLNGLVLGNNWGDLIRLLDKALVTGVDFTQITAASIDAQGDVHLTLFAPHKALLLQVVELTDFEPLSLNQKYRIKGVPSPTQLILKPQNVIAETAVTTKGTGKLASLGYDIIFRDNNDVKRVYRAKNPTSQHPFIRVDESLTSPDGASGVYASTYAKSAMVGLFEHMDHIDDYQNANVLQLPLDTTDFAKNWKIAGTGTSVVRGRCKLYWGLGTSGYSTADETTAPNNTGVAPFSLCGDKHAVYLINEVTRHTSTVGNKSLKGFGLINTCLADDVIPAWFLAVPDRAGIPAGTSYSLYNTGGMPTTYSAAACKVLVPKYNVAIKLSNSVGATPIVPDYNTGLSNLFGSSNVGALEIPIYDGDLFLRGTLKHVCYSGNSRGVINTTPVAAGASMYVCDNIYGSGGGSANLYFYLGELE